ncbi:uncharacterized protein LOC100206382 isoform X1 [Hydra vulgaris]|uniref:uncharacterized protein LOC100206382 isoform X1 n=1 Tax=Hydra vulgaris TaxID=6087 RepID=UPI001F5E70D8|nr:uncharacterized protein LOC100206382 [Hydra vulgaris]
METFFCKCANVTINIVSIKNSNIEIKDLVHIEDVENIVRPFFKNKLIEVIPAANGIEVAQNILLLQRSVNGWKVSLCLNCGCYTHATNQDQRLLLSENLDHGKSKYSEILNSKKFSKIFNFKLMNEDIQSNTTQKIHFKELSKTYEQLEAFFKKVILLEEDAVRERIRIYTANQLEEFQDFKLRASNEKDTLKNSIKRFEDPDEYESLFGLDAGTKSIIRGSNNKFQNLYNEKTYSTDTLNRSTISNSSHFQESKSQKLTQTKSRSPIKRSDSNNEDFFDFEGFHDSKSYETFVESDDDSSGDTASLESSGGGFSMQITSQGTNSSERMYATSVPVSIQMFNTRKHSYEPYDEDDLDELSPSPSHIADSIKALAKSVQDSTAMFGELPRTRFNTIPYSLR